MRLCIRSTFNEYFTAEAAFFKLCGVPKGITSKRLADDFLSGGDGANRTASGRKDSPNAAEQTPLAADLRHGHAPLSAPVIIVSSVRNNRQRVAQPQLLLQVRREAGFPLAAGHDHTGLAGHLAARA